MRTDPRGGAWIHIEDPRDDEQAWLTDELGVPADWVRDAVDPYQRPRFQRLGDLVLLLVLCARTAHQRPEPFATVPLAIVLQPDRAITICRKNPDLLDEIDEGDSVDPRGIALELLVANEHVFRDDLAAIHDRSTLDEERLRESLTGSRLGELIDHGRSLAYFDSALRANDRMLEGARDDGLFGKGDLVTVFDEVRERNEENAELAQVFTRIHNDLMEGFSSLVSMNLNALVRTLTEVTIALAVPALIAAMWGMNVSLPFEDVEIAFAVLTALIVVLAVVAFVLIRFAERFGRVPGRRS